MPWEDLGGHLAGRASASFGARAAGSGFEPDPDWAWRAYRPSESCPWTLARAGHLYRRLGFGARWAELQESLRRGPQATLDRLLSEPKGLAEFNAQFDELSTSAGQADSPERIAAWWLRRMLETPFPFLEKMTLFWHHHFAASALRAKNPRLFAGYLSLLRQHALGGFDTLLAVLTEHPVVLLSAGAEANRRAQPNLAWGRTFLEQFCLGPAVAQSEEIGEVARAWTGWFVLNFRVRFIPGEHDPGPKKLFGREGPFAARDVLELVVSQAATHRYIVGKLYRWFIADDPPSQSLLEPLVNQFGKDRDIGRLVSTMVRSNLFFSDLSYRRKVKSPVDMVLGLIRGMESLVPTTVLAQDLAELGQDLSHPPTVAGWAQGMAWLHPASQLQRLEWASAFFAEQGRYQRIDPWEVARRNGAEDGPGACRWFVSLVLQDDLSDESRGMLKAEMERMPMGTAEDRSSALRQFAVRLTCLPEFHLA